MEELTNVSSKSTKHEIFEAYTKLLEKVKSKKSNDSLLEFEEINNKEVVRNVSDITTDTIFDEINNLKINIGKNLDDISGKLEKEIQKLDQIRKAIEIETKHLDNVFQIKDNAYSLNALILAQNESKEKFEKEIEVEKLELNNQMKELKENLTREKKKVEIELEEYKNQVDRQKEEYKYNFELMQKKDLDLYEAKKSDIEKELKDMKLNFEKDIKEREQNLSEKEKEFLDLQEQISTFPHKLETSLLNKEKETVDKLEFKYNHEIELMKKEIDAERKLYEQRLTSYEEKIKTLSDQLRIHSQQLAEANKRVENIAVKVVEGSPARFINRAYYDETDKKDSKRDS